MLHLHLVKLQYLQHFGLQPYFVHSLVKYHQLQLHLLIFFDYFEFEGAVNYLLTHMDIAGEMGRQGRAFVLDHFAWDVIVKKYTAYFERLCRQREE